MDISQLYQLLGMYSGVGNGYGLYGNYGNYGNYNSYGQNTFSQVLRNTAANTTGGISTPMMRSSRKHRGRREWIFVF